MPAATVGGDAGLATAAERGAELGLNDSNRIYAFVSFCFAFIRRQRGFCVHSWGEAILIPKPPISRLLHDRARNVGKLRSRIANADTVVLSWPQNV